MRCVALAGLLAASLAGPARSEVGPVLDRTDAFERGFAVSLYLFDACGDPLAGRMFRRALAERFAQCPFSPAARSRYQQRILVQQAKVRTALQSMIETRGGLPVQLDGMAMTCREQQASEDYKRVRVRLEQYAQQKLPAEAVIAAPCDASDITP